MLRPGLTVLRRYLSSTEAVLSSSKKNLQQLRKKTGFSFANCRKALDKFGNDLNQAEAWLLEQAQKEGWSKATKLKGRTTAQGLIGVMRDGTRATMVEVNCETDFVAKNSEFQGFVSQTAAVALQQLASRQAKDLTGVTKILYSGEEMKEFSLGDQKTLKDLTAMTIGKVGENMSLSRALCMVAPSDHFIGTYVHSVLQAQHKSKCMVGKYGALVAFKRTGDASTEFRAGDIGRRLCQHVVGMNPVTVGEHAALTAETTEPPKKHDPRQDTPSAREDGEVETAMLKQEYLLDPTMTVGELVLQENLEIIDFARFECGESPAGEENS